MVDNVEIVNEKVLFLAFDNSSASTRISSLADLIEEVLSGAAKSTIELQCFSYFENKVLVTQSKKLRFINDASVSPKGFF